ncbi:MAG: glucosyl-3-phosphoglycerate synthase [Desulfobulbaceae bacterium]|nr:glucosyl-3-phosphoglycerate synthase [Desulfobulbaceae bacterium]
MSNLVKKWLRENTFHHSQFWDILQLIEEKQKQNLRISLCLPTYNEEATIGKEVVIFKSELQDRYPLLDEIAVIDSGSTDSTCEVAASFGAAVYQSADILPEMGFNRGKGENLWKAIHQLTGDIIVYVDADIKNIHSRFVYGLVAPLIYRSEIKYVKAFYDRPLVSRDKVRPSGGGRVTEILVRPLFSLFYPELTAIIQPLSGEYAVRREILEQLSFPVGYGVETAHLLDIYAKWGMGAFAQTDLDKRVHRHQQTRDLGKMSFGILRAFFKRLKAQGAIGDLPELSPYLMRYQALGNEYETELIEIFEKERPAMLEVEAYRKKFGR